MLTAQGEGGGGGADATARAACSRPKGFASMQRWGGQRCSARVGVGLLMRRLALGTHNPGVRWGEAAALALLSHQGRATDASACAARSRPMAGGGGRAVRSQLKRKMRGGQWCSLCLAVGVGPMMRLRAKFGGGG